MNPWVRTCRLRSPFAGSDADRKFIPCSPCYRSKVPALQTGSCVVQSGQSACLDSPPPIWDQHDFEAVVCYAIERNPGPLTKTKSYAHGAVLLPFPGLVSMLQKHVHDKGTAIFPGNIVESRDCILRFLNQIKNYGTGKGCHRIIIGLMAQTLH